MYLQMSNRGNGPPPRKSRRIETRKRPSAALGAPVDTPQANSDDITLDDNIQRKIKDTITSIIPQITSSVLSALKGASGGNTERIQARLVDQTDVHNLEDILPLTSGDTNRDNSTPSNLVNDHQTDNLAGTNIQNVVTNSDSDTHMHSHTPLFGRQSISKPLTLGINPKIKGMIWENEFVDLGVLLTHNTPREKFRMVENSNSLGYEKIPPAPYRFQNMTHWMSAFHIFVSIYCEKYPMDAGKLMKYASIIENLAKQSSELAAFKYDRVFRSWRERDVHNLPWDQLVVELYQDALAEGLAEKTKMLIPPPNRQFLNTSQIQVHVPSRNNRAIQQGFNQSFRAQSPLQTRKSVCYVFNNKDGWCSRGTNCPFEHICQFCGSAYHTKKWCPSNTKIVHTQNRQVNNKTFASKQNHQTKPNPKSN